jgi:excisionase family DNA binding protein
MRGFAVSSKREVAALVVALTVDDFGAALDIDRRTVIRMIDAGHVRAVRVGTKLIRIPRSELDRILAGDARVA